MAKNEFVKVNNLNVFFRRQIMTKWSHLKFQKKRKKKYKEYHKELKKV